MDASLALGRRYALDAMRSRFEFQPGVDAAACDSADDLLVTTVFAISRRQDFHLPAHRLGVARVHAEQVARENRGFVAARAGTDLQVDVAVVVRVRRD